MHYHDSCFDTVIASAITAAGIPSDSNRFTAGAPAVADMIVGTATADRVMHLLVMVTTITKTECARNRMYSSIQTCESVRPGCRCYERRE